MFIGFEFQSNSRCWSGHKDFVSRKPNAVHNLQENAIFLQSKRSAVDANLIQTIQMKSAYLFGEIIQCELT